VTQVQLAPGQSVVPTIPIAAAPATDLGRYDVTGRPEDRWRFRTPTLSNVAVTAPYMHDGSFPTLAAVIDYYAGGGAPHEGQDPRIAAFELEPDARDDLVAFLHALTGANVDALAADARSVAIGDPG
jgi:cytochrome c peroxidase